MFLSKSFGYALRGILYVAAAHPAKQRIRVDEIAGELAIPKYFLGKIMKKVVLHGILNSAKGPRGGFFLNENTLSTTLFDLMLITDLDSPSKDCLLGFRECNSNHPCPLHGIGTFRDDFYQAFSKTTIGDLVGADKPQFVRSISTQSLK